MCWFVWITPLQIESNNHKSSRSGNNYLTWRAGGVWHIFQSFPFIYRLWWFLLFSLYGSNVRVILKMSAHDWICIIWVTCTKCFVTLMWEKIFQTIGKKQKQVVTYIQTITQMAINNFIIKLKLTYITCK